MVRDTKDYVYGKEENQLEGTVKSLQELCEKRLFIKITRVRKWSQLTLRIVSTAAVYELMYMSGHQIDPCLKLSVSQQQH